jgi:hypothetical protein
MLITRKSLVSGIYRTLSLPITQDQLDRWANGEIIQSVFKHLSDDQREFLMTGITPEEWNETFSEYD